MDATILIPLAMRAGVLMTVFVLGLSTTPADATYLLRRPGQLSRSLLAMLVVMPLFTAAMIALFDLKPPVETGLLALSVSPIPPLLPRKALKSGGGASYTIGLLVAAALLAIGFVPLAVSLLGLGFGRAARVPPAAVAMLVAITVLLPLMAGVAVRRLLPRVADRIAKPITLVASVLLVGAIVPILYVAMPAIVSLLGDGTLIATVAFVVVGITVGHLLGGPEPRDRTVLALTTSSRHPGVAMAIAKANYPHPQLTMAAILLYLLVNLIVSIGYLAWCKRRHTKTPTAP